MKHLKFLWCVLIWGGTVIANPNYVKAEWIDYNLDAGLSRIAAGGNYASCSYRLHAVSADSAAIKHSFFPLESFGFVSSSATTAAKFSVPLTARHDLSGLIPLSGRLSYAGTTYAGSGTRPDYLTYVEESATDPYDCSLQLARPLGSTARIVPQITCSRTRNDLVTSVIWILSPTYFGVQENCR